MPLFSPNSPKFPPPKFCAIQYLNSKNVDAKILSISFVSVYIIKQNFEMKYRIRINFQMTKVTKKSAVSNFEIVFSKMEQGFS